MMVSLGRVAYTSLRQVLKTPAISGWTMLILILCATMVAAPTPYRYGMLAVLGVAYGLYYRSLLLVRAGSSPQMLSSFQTERNVILSYLGGFLLLSGFYATLLWHTSNVIYSSAGRAATGGLNHVTFLEYVTDWTPVSQTLVVVTVVGCVVAFWLQFWSVVVLTEQCSPAQSFIHSIRVVYGSFWFVCGLTAIRLITPLIVVGLYAFLGIVLSYSGGISEQGLFAYIIGFGVLTPFLLGFYYYTKVELYNSLSV